MKRRAFAALGCLPLAMSASRSALAQNQPLHLVVPYSPGGQTDVLMRVVSESMSKTLDKPIIIENRPGAAALIGTRFVMNAPPDGNTILSHNSGYAALPFLQKSATYVPHSDMAAVAMFGVSPNFLMVTDAVPANSIADFITWARQQKQGVECANSGTGSGGHISALLFAKLANVPLVHVPFKGSADVTNALISGQVKMQISVTTDSLNPFIKSGKVRILGVASKERSRLAPEVPSISEVLPGYAIDGWFGLLAPPKTPLPVREAVADALKKAMDLPVTRERFLALYMEPKFKGPAAFADDVQESETNFKHIIADELGLTPT